VLTSVNLQGLGAAVKYFRSLGLNVSRNTTCFSSEHLPKDVSLDQNFTMHLGSLRLEKLHLKGAAFDAAFIAALAPHLAGLTALQKLNLWGNELSDDGFAALAPHLAGLTALQELDLCGNQISDDGIAALAPHLAGLTALQKLGLSGNQISNVGYAALTEGLS